MKVVQALSWLSTLTRSSVSFRVKLVERILEDIRNFRGVNPERPEPKIGESLFKELKDRSRYRLIGVVGSVNYVRVGNQSSDKDYDLNAQYTHAFGTPALLFWHMKSCCMLIVGPNVRHDRTVFAEYSLSREQLKHFYDEYLGIKEPDPKGFTG